MQYSRSSGLWSRFFAAIIDYILLVFFSAVGLFAGEPYPAVRIVITILSMLYAPLMLWRFGATFGKMICHIRVVEVGTSATLGFGKALLREIIGKPLSALFFYLGYLWILIDPQGRSWHDKIAGTHVVYTSEDPSIDTDTSSAPIVSRTRKVLFWMLLTVFAITSLILPALTLAYLFVLRPVEVTGSAMAPAYLDKQYILTSRIAYRSSEPMRGDVVIHKSPQNSEVVWIKRIVGLPGERIMISGGIVHINGSPLDESTYLPAGTVTSPGKFMQEGADVLIPEDHYVVLGDNRANSADSREYGFVSETAIEGKALMCYRNCRK